MSCYYIFTIYIYIYISLSYTKPNPVNIDWLLGLTPTGHSSYDEQYDKLVATW